FSTSATRLPAFTALIAARCPPGPEPITISSYGCIYVFLCVRFVRWGGNGAGLRVRSSIDDLRIQRRTRARRINNSGSELHEMLLRGEAVPIPHRLRTRVCPVGVQDSSFARVGQVRSQNVVADAMTKLRIFDREHCLDALIKVARHPVGTAEIYLWSSAVLEK